MHSNANSMDHALQDMPRVRASLNRLLTKFCSIFRDNSKRLRLSFFSDALVQFMWTRYIDAESDFIASYLSELINVRGKQSEAATLLKDVMVLSCRLNFEILRPDFIQFSVTRRV